MEINVLNSYLQQAYILHKENPVIDAHLDLAGEILLRYNKGEKQVIKNHYLPYFKEAGINVLFCAIYVESAMLPEMGLRNALNQIGALYEDLKSVAGDVFLIRNRKDLDRAIQEDKTGIIIYMEGLDCIGKDVSLLPILFELGVRGASLTWSRRNEFATGCSSAGRNIQIKGGLSEAGRQAVKELERLGMFIDISHLNDDGFEELMTMTEKPVIATHSNAKAVWDNYRNLTDEQMEILAKQGGVMGLNGCSIIAGSRQRKNHLEMLCNHVEYVISHIGADCVGYGFDLCDSYDEAKQGWLSVHDRVDCFENHGRIPMLSAALLQRGLKEEEVVKIIGGNFYRYLNEMLPE